MKETIAGTKIKRFPLTNLTLIADLVYFDGPFLSQYRDIQGNDYLFYWVDSDTVHNRWLILDVDSREIEDYTNGEISLLNLLQSTDGPIYSVDADNDGEYDNISVVNLSELPDSYLPMPDAYHDEDYARFYQDNRESLLQYNMNSACLIEVKFWQKESFRDFPPILNFKQSKQIRYALGA